MLSPRVPNLVPIPGITRSAAHTIAFSSTHKPHRSLSQRPPMRPAPLPDTHPHQLQVTKSTPRDELINEYRHAA